jgi:hypothetical protein
MVVVSASASGTPSTNVETGAGRADPEAVEAAATATAIESTTLTPEQAIVRLRELRARLMAILEAVKAEYARRVRPGYPMLIDNVERGGVFGMTFDSGWGVYFMTDGESVFAELHTVDQRYDTLSAANAEKFGGSPLIQRRDLDPTWTDLQYRNLISELLHIWNWQQTRIYRTDS